MFNWKKNIRTKQDALQAIAFLEKYLEDADNPDFEFDYQILATTAIKVAKYGMDLPLTE